VIPEQLRAAGAELDSVVVYRHVDVDRFEPEVEQRLAAGELHWIALSSPSIARNLARLVPAGQRAQVRFAAISPVTAAVAREAGLQIEVIAEEYTWAGLLAAIERSHCQA
jgi:uroporphyrinogen-III synthase